MPMYTVPTLINRVWRHIGEHESRSNIDAQVTLDYINDHHESLCNKILKIVPDFLSTYIDYTLDGSREYTLPKDIFRICGVENITGGANNPTDTVPIRFEERFRYLHNFRGLDDYYINDGRLGIPSKMSAGILRVYYPFTPKEMFYGTVVTATSTGFIITSTTDGSIVGVDDRYNGMFDVNSYGEFKEITDYVGSSNTFTVDSAWSTTPTDGNTIVSICSPIWPRFQQLIHLGAGINFLLDIQMPITDKQNIYNDLWEDMAGRIKIKQTQTSHSIAHVR